MNSNKYITEKTKTTMYTAIVRIPENIDECIDSPLKNKVIGGDIISHFLRNIYLY